MLLIFDVLRVPISFALAILVLALIANMNIKTTSPKGATQSWKGSLVEKTKAFWDKNVIKSLVIVAVLTFVFSKLMEMLNYQLGGPVIIRGFWGDLFY